jgi:hypothetical protein
MPSSGSRLPTCGGSHLWPYRAINRVAEPTFLHCLTGGARRLDHIWHGFASSIRTWQYRSANSTRLRPTSKKQSAGGVAQQEAPTPAPLAGPPLFVEPFAHHPSSLSKCHSRSQPLLAIGLEQSRDLPDDAKKARSLIRWTAEDLAAASALSVATIRRAELKENQTALTSANDLAIRRA